MKQCTLEILIQQQCDERSVQWHWGVLVTMVIQTQSVLNSAYEYWYQTDSCWLFLPPGLWEVKRTASYHLAKTPILPINPWTIRFIVTSKYRYCLNVERGTEPVNDVIIQSAYVSDHIISCSSWFSWGQGKLNILFESNKRPPCDCMLMRANYYIPPMPSTQVSFHFLLLILAWFL